MEIEFGWQEFAVINIPRHIDRIFERWGRRAGGPLLAPWLHNAHVTAKCPFRECCAFCGWEALGMLAAGLFSSERLRAWCWRRAESIEPGRLHRAWCRWDV
jgi:hypothetical protein